MNQPNEIGSSTKESLCPNCGAPLLIANPAMTKTAVCQYCQSIVKIYPDQFQKGSKLPAGDFQPKSALRLGLEGTIDGARHQIVGRVRYENTVGEFWDEWLLLCEDGQYAWLQEDDWEFTLLRKFTPAVPFDPESAREYVEIEEKRLEVEERSTATLTFLEGELTWRAEIAEKVNFLDAWDAKILYSTEWTENEIQYFFGREIEAAKVYSAFNLGPLPEEAVEVPPLLQILLRGPAFKITLVFAILFLLTGLVMSFSGVPVPTLGAPSKEGKSTIVGPFELTRMGRAYKITVGTRFSNAELYVEFNLLNEAKEPVMSFDADFWHESGYDSEGYWSEKELSKTMLFRISEPGKYFLEITPEKETSPPIDASIKDSCFSTRYLFIFGGITAVYPAILGCWWLVKTKSDDED